MSIHERRISSLEEKVSNLLGLLDHQAVRICELEEALVQRGEELVRYEEALAGRDEQLAALAEELEAAQAEIRRLKKLPAKPKMQASQLDKPQQSDEDQAKGKGKDKGKRPGSEKAEKRKNLEIHEHRLVSAQGVPVGWTLKGYEAYVVQDLLIRANNISYDREVWVSPDGAKQLVASLPAHLHGKHFGETLQAYVLHQYYHSGVSQPLIHEGLSDHGVLISTGQISNLLTLNREAFHSEKCSLLDKAIELKQELRTDDTGARHEFKSGSCNCINSDLFTYFTTSASKSRINFLEILRREHTNYEINEEALAYASAQGLSPKYYTVLERSLAQGQGSFADSTALEAYFKVHGWKAKHAIRTITEALLIGALVGYGVDSNTLIHSDGARQFDLFNHSLCWKHAERPLLKLRCYNDRQEQLLHAKQKAFWSLYQELKAYKKQPDAQQVAPLTRRFEQLCEPVTNYQSLNQVLEELKPKQEELLRVLSHPQASLQNNASERDIREYVKRRKISAGTRSEQGKQARDTFLSLKKTCRKLGLSFWEYLLDRITQAEQVPPLSLIMHQKAMGAAA